MASRLDKLRAVANGRPAVESDPVNAPVAVEQPTRRLDALRAFSAGKPMEVAKQTLSSSKPGISDYFDPNGGVYVNKATRPLDVSQVTEASGKWLAPEMPKMVMPPLQAADFFNQPTMVPSEAAPGSTMAHDVPDVSPKPPAIGLGEAFTDNPAKFVPVFGSVVEMDRLLAVRGAAKRLETDSYTDGIVSPPSGYMGGMVLPKAEKQTAEQKREADAKLVSDWMNEAEEKRIRGYSFGGRVGQILGDMPSYMGEIALTSGLYSGGKKLTEKALLGGLKKYVEQGAVRSAIRKTAVPVAGWAVGGVLQGTAQPQRIARGLVERRMPNATQDEEGNLQFQWPEEKPLTSFVRAWGDTVIEVASEQSGGAVNKVLGVGLTKLPFGGKLMRRLYDGYEKLHPGTTWGQFIDKVADKVAFNGMLGELGEEYIGDQLRAITDVDDFGADQQAQKKHGRQANTLERMNAAFQQDLKMTPEMAASFAVPGTVQVVGKLSGEQQEQEATDRIQRLRDAIAQAEKVEEDAVREQRMSADQMRPGSPPNSDRMEDIEGLTDARAKSRLAELFASGQENTQIIPEESQKPTVGDIAEKATEGLSPETAPQEPLGKRQSVFGEDMTLAGRSRQDGVDYELWSGDKNHVLRIYDADSGEIVGITKYQDIAQASKAFSVAVQANGGKIELWEGRNELGRQESSTDAVSPEQGAGTEPLSRDEVKQVQKITNYGLSRILKMTPQEARDIIVRGTASENGTAAPQATGVPTESPAPVAAEAPAAAETRQSWEMSLLDYGKGQLPESQRGQITDPRQVKSFSAQHIKDIRAALERGEMVPEGVLREYRGTAWADEALSKLEAETQTTPEAPATLPAEGDTAGVEAAKQPWEMTKADFTSAVESGTIQPMADDKGVGRQEPSPTPERPGETNSKIADVVYHYSDIPIETFTESKSKGIPGYFVEQRNPKYAEKFGDVVTPVKLDIRTPLDLTSYATGIPGLGHTASQWLDIFESHGIDVDKFQFVDELNNTVKTREDFADWADDGLFYWSFLDSDKGLGETNLLELIREAGYDGIKAIEDGETVWVPFSPGQISNTSFEPPAGQPAPGISHAQIVQQAVSEGKPVPRHVLEEYKGEAWADEALAQAPIRPSEPQTPVEAPADAEAPVRPAGPAVAAGIEAPAATETPKPEDAKEIITPIPGDLGEVTVRKTPTGYEVSAHVLKNGKTISYPPSGPHKTPHEALASGLQAIRHNVPAGTTEKMDSQFRKAWGLDEKSVASEGGKGVESTQEASNEPRAEQSGTQRDRGGEAEAPEGAPTESLSVSQEPGEGDGARPDSPGAGGSVHGQGGRGGTSVRGNKGRDTGDVDKPARHGQSPRRKSSSGDRRDYRITDSDNIEAGGERTKYKANVEAIRTLKKIEAEGRLATPEEQAILVKYTGWGGLKNAFEGWQKGWENAPKELREILTDEEFASARRSTPNAHYTSPAVVKGIWAGLERLGFKGGRINEPAIGTGIFYGLIPDSVASASQLFGVELDSISARIAKQLYQSASIENRGFQDVRYPDNFFDLFVSNVPFDEKTHPHDPDMPRNVKFNLHDFYFAKAIKKTRPGGLIAFITSKGTMDKASPLMRQWMSKQADFVGAIRLPRSAFGKIAGTEVVTDIVVFQKRESGKDGQGVPFENVAELEQGGNTFTVNEYFVSHPGNILGKLSYEGSMYRSNELTVEDTGIDLGAKVEEVMGGFKVPVDINADLTKRDAEMHLQDYQKLAPENVKERAYVIDGKDVYQNIDGVMHKIKRSKGVIARFKRMIAVRDAARRLISLQINPEAADAEVEAARKELRKQYDSFVGDYKPFHVSYNKALFYEDPDQPLLLALEDWDGEKKTATKAKIFTDRTQFPVKRITSADTPQDAVAVSLSEKANIDIDFIASLLDIEPEKAAEQILGQAYENPETGRWEPNFLYLSGNVRKKLDAARAAAELDPKYKVNVEALESVQPEDIGAADISVRLGSSWVPESVYGDFVAHLTGRRTAHFKVLPHDGSWVVSGGASSPQWETGHFRTTELLAVIMNHRRPKVWYKDADGNRRLNEEATTAAEVAAGKIRDEFERWIWSNAERTKSLARLYNDTFNHSVHPRWDGSYLQFPGQSHTILHDGKLRPHQYNAVARFLTSGNLLMAHAVGAGKTYAGISMAMEARRTGLARKPVFVVPNHKVDDWRVDFMKLYPSANILSATKKDFEVKNRQRLMNRIATGDWDAVIVPMSSFEKIQMSPARVQAFFRSQVDELEMMIQESRTSRGSDNKSITKQLEKSKTALEERLKKMSAAWKKDAGPYFDELGIDMLFVDESHAYKNLFFVTKMERISGLQVSQTQRSMDMYLKTQYLNETTNNRGVVFATGTPITNTIGEMYTLQRYLQPQTLDEAGISAFDFWATAFGDTVTDVEVDPTGGGFRVNTRFAKFTNLPELMQMFRGVADIVTKKQMGIPLPKLKTGKPITIQSEPTDDVKDYIASLVDRAEHVHMRRVRPDEDNMLKITNDGRHAALDPRLRIPGAKDDPGSKINKCVAGVKRIYDETTKDKGTQVIWCDLSTPNKGWSVYHEIKQKLIASGINKDQIAFAHDAKDEKQQALIYDKLNKGKLRVIIASTGKMGTGANIQRRLKAAHHLTAPWVPAEVEQRDGRIERQGNMYEEVEVYQYVTRGTFDAYMWQTLETKAKFIEQAINGESTAREIEDVSKSSLTYAEIKALSSGNPKILEAVRLDAEVKALQAQEKAHRSEQIRMREQAHAELPARIRADEQDIRDMEKDVVTAKKALEKAGTDVDFTIRKKHYTKRSEAATALAEALNDVNKLWDSATEIGSAYGFKLAVIWQQPFGAGGGWWRLRLHGNGVHGVDLGDSDTGNITRIINGVAGIEDKLKQVGARLEDQKRRLADMRKAMDAPFEKAGELSAKKAKLQQLHAELRAPSSSTKPAASQSGDQDPTIDVPSAQGGFAGGRPRAAAHAKLSAIVNEKLTTGSQAADSFLKRNRGFGLSQKIISGIRAVPGHLIDFGREFHFLPHLPKTEAFAKVRESFRHMMEISKKAHDDATEAMKWALQPIKGTKREVARRYDAVVMKLQADSLTEDIEKGVALPPGMTEADVQAMRTEADRLYAEYPSVRQAYDRIREKTQEVTDMLLDMGWLTKEQAKEFYFPHRVIKYLQQNRGFFGVPRKLSVPHKGYLKQRKGGSDYAIDLDYLMEHWAQVRRDVGMTKFMETVLQREQKEHFRKDNPNWKRGDPVPAGFKEVTVLPGRFYYRAHGISEDLAMALVNQNLAMIEAALEEKNQKGLDAVRTVLAVGRKRSFIVREEVARQIEDMPTAPIVGEKGALAAGYNAVKSFNTFVKGNILFNPLYAWPFHVTNFLGDAHKVMVALPKSLVSKHMAGYWQAILDAHAGKKSALFDEAQRLGVIGSGWLGVEVKNLKALMPQIARAEISGAGDVAWDKAKRLFNLLKTAGQSREDWLRYATFAHLVDLQNKGVDITKYSTKDMKVIKGLEAHEKAAKIARDILGDYSAIGKSGRVLSDLAVPFYRWMHLNLPWWPRLLKEYGGRGDAGRLAAALVAASAPYIAAALWNYSDEDRRKFEKKLPAWKRWTFHIVNRKGTKLYYVPVPLDDLVQFFGIDNSLSDYTAYQKGIIDFRTLVYRIAANSVKEPALGAINAVGGLAGVARDALGIKTFPEIAPYRITDPEKRLTNVAKDVFGAPAQLMEAVRRDDDTKVRDLLWRSVSLARPWTPTSDPFVVLSNSTYADSQKENPEEPLKWEPHKGKRADVDRLKAQVSDMSKEEVTEARKAYLEGKAEESKKKRAESWKNKLPNMTPEQLIEDAAKNSYRSSGRGQDGKAHKALSPHADQADYVGALKAEYESRTGKPMSNKQIVNAQLEISRRERMERLKKIRSSEK